ncbi:MAG: methionine synthase, partial [Propionibacteriaceae bacterium]|nr:methionine synthase [Propionibacteriaceae bacterium]
MTIVTGLGSWPGVDVVEAVDQTREAFPVSPFLPELPARGLGSDMVGRTLGLIEDLAFEPSVTGWATAAHTSRAQRAARAAARDDLDIAADLFQDHAGPFHVTLAGPWTLAALV